MPVYKKKENSRSDYKELFHYMTFSSIYLLNKNYPVWQRLGLEPEKKSTGVEAITIKQKQELTKWSRAGLLR